MINGFKEKYSFLSIYYPTEIEYEGIKYNCPINAFLAQQVSSQIQKKQIAKSAPSRSTIMVINSEEKVNLTTEQQLEIMYNICKIKFSDENLKQSLLSTKNEELVDETDWNNKFWGVTNGEGENHIGKILMKIRDELSVKDESEKIENESTTVHHKKKKGKKQ